MDNIVLIGFMGSGKTGVGRELARLLSIPFYDMDEMLEFPKSSGWKGKRDLENARAVF